ncbi:MAG: alpha-L-fucosidase [Lentisphaeria bacterium]|nr:alpha-L-fucosidase [Lentisphaeria bacterium]
MTIARTVQNRIDRLMKWYLPSRLGIFYHYGLFTGGGKAVADPSSCKALTYKSPEEFEAAAPDPEAVAKNLVQNALDMGAGYMILTLIHTCGGLMMLYPTKQPEFRRKTTLDYIGAYLRAARAAGLYPMLYYPGDCHNHDAAETLGAVAPEITPDGCEEFFELSVRVTDELKERYGDLIAGFWLDGDAPGHFSKLPGEIRKRFPDAVITVNSRDEFSITEQDMGTTEFCGEKPDPPYNRAGTFRKENPWRKALPPKNLNEDIPAPNNWWYQGPGTVKQEYLDDRFFLLRQMITSLGQQGMWNFAPGIGPMIDGRVPPELRPSLEAISEFLKWGGEAVYGTRGPAGTFFSPGFFQVLESSGFYSVTTPLQESNIFYALVTEKPSGSYAFFETSGHEPKRITDLRTKRIIPFEMWHGAAVKDHDWSDVDERGVAVLKFEF